ncbi:pyridoxal phosphate-dependent aminotransferase, partial [Streptomyces anthocyanicus]
MGTGINERRAKHRTDGNGNGTDGPDGNGTHGPDGTRARHGQAARTARRYGMRRTDPEGLATKPAGHDSAGRHGAGPGAVGHGPVRYGPHFPDDGLPVLPELSAVLAA